MIDSDSGNPRAALESLATALDPREFVTVLVAGDGCRPCLTVVNRRTFAAENIHVDRLTFWWQWAEPIAAMSDPLAAAHRITNVLGVAPASMTQAWPNGRERLAHHVLRLVSGEDEGHPAVSVAGPCPRCCRD